MAFKKYVNWTTLSFAHKPPRDLKYCERIKVETTSFKTKTDQNGVSNGHGDVKLFMHIYFFSSFVGKASFRLYPPSTETPLELSEIFLKNHGSWNYTWNLFVLYFWASRALYNQTRVIWVLGSITARWGGWSCLDMHSYQNWEDMTKHTPKSCKAAGTTGGSIWDAKGCKVLLPILRPKWL